MSEKDRKFSKEKIKQLIFDENRNAVLDSLILCKFSMRFYNMEDYCKIASQVLRKEINLKEFQKMGEEIVRAERVFNVKAGLSKKDDSLPKRLEIPGIHEALDTYYSLRGWNSLAPFYDI
jgi:aldehyde:ferredoxin oxidoreductase